MTEQLPALIFLAPLATAISLPIAGYRNDRVCRPAVLGAVSLMAVLSIASLWTILEQGDVHYSFSGWIPPIGIEWVADPLAAMMVAAVSVLGVLCVLYANAIGDSSVTGRTIPYHTLILLLVAGLTGAAYAGDLFNIFVFLEVVSLSAYALVAVRGGRALVSAFRYLLMGTIGTSLYLLGVAYFYAATGTLNLADLAQRLPDLMQSKAVMGGLTFMFSGLAIKMALMPLHGWLPDAYRDAPSAITPLLAGLITKIALLVWVRILFWGMVPAQSEGTVPMFTLVAILGMLASVAGACLALYQKDLKRMFAYGGISHVGLVLIGVGQANQTGLTGSMYYLLNDAVMQCGLFVLAGFIVQRYGVRTLDDLGRARIRNPWAIATFVVVGLGMIGLPPTGGFFGKWRILQGTLEAGNNLAAAAIVVTTLVTLGYFAQIFEKLVRKGDSDAEGDEAPTRWELRTAMLVLTVSVVALGLLGDSIIEMLQAATGGLGT